MNTGSKSFLSVASDIHPLCSFHFLTPFPGSFSPYWESIFFSPPPPQNYIFSSAFFYILSLALTITPLLHAYQSCYFTHCLVPPFLVFSLLESLHTLGLPRRCYAYSRKSPNRISGSLLCLGFLVCPKPAIPRNPKEYFALRLDLIREYNVLKKMSTCILQNTKIPL